MGDVVLVTIVAEAVLESRLLRELHDAGAHGWTVTDARGEGPRNRRTGDIAGGNVRIESVVSPAVADAVIARLVEGYFPHFACIAWTAPVQVVRTEKFA